MHCSDWPHGLGLIDVGLGLARFFWPRPHTFWPQPHDTLASLTSLPVCPVLMWSASIRCGRPLALDALASYYTSYQRQHVRLFQTSTEDTPVSMSGLVILLQLTSPLRNCSGGGQRL